MRTFKLYRTLFLSAIVFFSISCSSKKLVQKTSDTSVSYSVDLTNPSDDLFHVTVDVAGLSQGNNIFHFAAVAPGTYANLNFGRFITSFKGYDLEGKQVKVEKLSTNQYHINEPQKLAYISYDIEDSYDSKKPGNKIFPMGGTEIDIDHATLNTFGVLGYFEGLQSYPVKLELKIPNGWMIGTALPKAEHDKNVFIAETYDHLADSPILLGKLSKSSTTVGKIQVDVYSYSSTGLFDAEELLKINEQVLQDAQKFISYAPVERYVFLMSFLDQKTIQKNSFSGFGALEHWYSSLYVLPEYEGIKSEIANISAHEFFHVITPLNLHSEVIDVYDFTKPRPSRHLWLYEGVTEWAADMMQLRNGSIKLENFLDRISQKISNDQERYDANYSLEKISLTSYNDTGKKQYGNIYERGAYIAGLLDIKLLELSGGDKGLREVLIELSKKYGKNNAFKDAEFYDIFVEETYSEIREFIDNYIRGTKKYPIKEYYELLGIDFIPMMEDSTPRMKLSFVTNDNFDLIVSKVGEEQKGSGVVPKMKLLSVEGEEVTAKNIGQVMNKVLRDKKIGDVLSIRLKEAPTEEEIKEGEKESGGEKELQIKLFGSTLKNVFKVNSKATEEQLELRNAWLKNHVL